MIQTLAGALISVTIVCSHADAREPTQRPNVVVILADDMGFSDLGCYGGEIATPNLDALASNGLRFTQFYNTARCCPTRASLLTGLYPHQAGVGHMMEDKGQQFPGYRGELNTSCRTIAEVLRTTGYGTYMVGKWHVTPHVRPDGDKAHWPLQRGFDRFYGTIHGAGSFFDPSSLTRDNTQVSAYADAEYKSETYYYTDAITDHAMRFLGDHARDKPEAPFFLYVAYTAAHWPMHALPQDIAKYKGRYNAGYDAIRQARFEKAVRLGLIDPRQAMAPVAEDWHSVVDKPWEAAGMEVYAAMVDRMDQGIGKIIAQLKRIGKFDNTLVLFLQDNGACAELQGRTGNNEHPDIARPDNPPLPPLPPGALITGTVPSQTRDGYPVRMGKNVYPGPADTYLAYGRGWANVSNTPFREYKHWVHEGGISTPLIAHWPAGISAKGELRKQPGHLIDIMATCVDLSGSEYPAGATPLEGRSLMRAFADQPIDRDAIYWEHEGNRAIRRGDWKAVAKGPGGKWELYDLSTDRVESIDLAAREPATLRELVGKWEAYAQRTNVLPWIWTPAYGEQTAPKNRKK